MTRLTLLRSRPRTASLLLTLVAVGCGDPLQYEPTPAPVRPPGQPHPDMARLVDLAGPDLGGPDLGVPDLALRDLSVVRDFSVVRDLVIFPDLRVVDLAVPSDLAVPVDLATPDGGPDLAIAMNKCRSGLYKGPFTGTIAGFQVSGTITLTFGLPVNQQLIVNPGTFVGTGPANSTITADISPGILDCRTLTFGGLLVNGVANILNQPVPFDGQIDANYDMNTQSIIQGTWSAMQNNGGNGRGMGTWSAK